MCVCVCVCVCVQWDKEDLILTFVPHTSSIVQNWTKLGKLLQKIKSSASRLRLKWGESE